MSKNHNIYFHKRVLFYRVSDVGGFSTLNVEAVLLLGQTVVHLVTALDPRVAGALIHGDAVPDVLSLLDAAVLQRLLELGHPLLST